MHHELAMGQEIELELVRLVYARDHAIPISLRGMDIKNSTSVMLRAFLDGNPEAVLFPAQGSSESQFKHLKKVRKEIFKPTKRGRYSLTLTGIEDDVAFTFKSEDVEVA